MTRSERTAPCCPGSPLTSLLSLERTSSDQPPTSATRVAQASSWSGQQKSHGRQEPTRVSPGPLSTPAPRQSLSLTTPSGPLPPPTPSLRRPPAPPSAPLRPPPPPPPWGADSPGCHVSLMTSPGPLGLSQSARGSPSEVLASESEGRGAGRGGGWGGEGVGNGADDNPSSTHAPEARRLAGS